MSNFCICSFLTNNWTLSLFKSSSEAVQVLVSLLADESPRVREKSMASLKDISPLSVNYYYNHHIISYIIIYNSIQFNSIYTHTHTLVYKYEYECLYVNLNSATLQCRNPLLVLDSCATVSRGGRRVLLLLPLPLLLYSTLNA